jgi:predicted component of type VI protein secretion system
MASEAARETSRPQPGTLLHVHVSLKGRTVKTFTFAHDEVSIGRDPDADIFLDNVGVSREHARFERTASGYVIEDLGSANGTFLNDKPVQRNLIQNDDIIQIGKYALRVSEKEERRGPEPHHPAGGATGAKLEHTTVLTRDQVVKVLSSSRSDEESDAPSPSPVRSSSPVPSGWSQRRVMLLGLAAGVAGGALGALVTAVLLR